MYCEIKDFHSDNTILTIDSIVYDSIVLPIYICGVVNRGNEIFITAPLNDLNIFQFFTLEGKLINTIITDLKFFGYGELDFYKVSGEYQIKNKMGF